MWSFLFFVCFLGFTNVSVRCDQDIGRQFDEMVAHLPYYRTRDIDDTWCLDIAGRPIPIANRSFYCFAGALILLDDNSSNAKVFQLDSATLSDEIREIIQDENFATRLSESIEMLLSASRKPKKLKIISESFYHKNMYVLLTVELPIDRQRFSEMIKRRELNYEVIKSENVSLFARMAVDGNGTLETIDSASGGSPTFHARSNEILKRDFGGKTSSIRLYDAKDSNAEIMERNFGEPCSVEGCWMRGREKCCLLENNPSEVFRRSIIQLAAEDDICFDYNAAILGETAQAPNGTGQCVLRYNPSFEFSPTEEGDVVKGECKNSTRRQAEIFGIETFGREITCNFDLMNSVEENREKLFAEQRTCMNSTNERQNAIACEYVIEKSTVSGTPQLTVRAGKNVLAVVEHDFQEGLDTNRCFYLQKVQKDVYQFKCICIGTDDECFTNPTELLQTELMGGGQGKYEEGLLTSTAITYSSCFPGRKIEDEKLHEPVEFFAKAYCYFVQDANTMQMVEEDIFVTENHDSESTSDAKITSVILEFLCNSNNWSMEEWNDGCKCVINHYPSNMGTTPDPGQNICCCSSFAYPSFRIIYSKFWKKKIN